MKRFFAIMVILAVLASVVCAFVCLGDNEVADPINVGGYDRAMISLPNGVVIIGAINEYTTKSFGVVELCVDHTMYLTSMDNVVMMYDCAE